MFDQGKVDRLPHQSGHRIRRTCVVVTTGTFLRGLMHIGQNKNEGGRLGDFSAKDALGESPGSRN
jgi:tRNA uridine 5-carboxymethylaminomethyl modification enzyme